MFSTALKVSVKNSDENKLFIPQIQVLKPIMAVMNQPGAYQPSDFQTGVCDCCDDIGTCKQLQTRTELRSFQM